MRLAAPLLVALALLPAAAAGQSPPPAATAPSPAPAPPALGRAREDLAGRDPQVRRRAAAYLGEAGTMDDVPALVQALRDSDRAVRALSERSLWQVWSRSGDPAVDALYARGMEQMGEGDADAAIATFSRVIARKPEFAEGWNKRATLYYLVGEYARSLADCDEVIKRNPSHFGALSGYGQIYLRLNQPEKALGYFERALAVNPNMEQVDAVIQELKALVREKRKQSI